MEILDEPENIEFKNRQEEQTGSTLKLRNFLEGREKLSSGRVGWKILQKSNKEKIKINLEEPKA